VCTGSVYIRHVRKTTEPRSGGPEDRIKLPLFVLAQKPRISPSRLRLLARTTQSINSLDGEDLHNDATSVEGVCLCMRVSNAITRGFSQVFAFPCHAVTTQKWSPKGSDPADHNEYPASLDVHIFPQLFRRF
jgi:hypothetical protein